jgi:hypothetical protein
MPSPRNLLAPCLVPLALALAAPAVQAANYNDATSDFSDNNLAPTAITLDVGSNLITGNIGTSPNDRDFFSFTLPAGWRLASVILTANSSSTSFIAVQDGGVILTADLNNGSALRGWEHFHEGYLNTSLLDEMGLNGKHFTPPLGAGEYTFWIQETSNPVKSYGFNFVVESTVAPAAVPAVPFLYTVLLCAGLLTAGVVALHAARQSRVSRTTSGSPSLQAPV